jgi:putative transposase
MLVSRLGPCLTFGVAYVWRKLTQAERDGLLAWRKQHAFPWHTPPHPVGGQGTFHLTAACLAHAPHLGQSPERLAGFCAALIEAVAPVARGIHAWCVLPNHYHLLVSATNLRNVTWALGKLHGRTSFCWNREDWARGRQVWHAAADRFMRGDRHFWATVNYIHHNPVRHGYVLRWQDWPYSSAHEFLSLLSREEAARIWREHPLGNYGQGWDEPWM